MKIVERDWESVPVTERDREENPLLRMMREQNLKVDMSRIPEVKPAFQGFRTDGVGYLWVLPSTRAETDGVVAVDIFDPDGRFLGRLRMPSNLRHWAIRGDRLCGVDVDELDVEQVTCFRIHR